MTLPRLPRRVWSQLGPIPVVRVRRLKGERGDDLLGRWCPDSRKIEIRARLSLATAWQTLYHEACHAWMWDAGCGGYHTFGEAGEERICDTLSSALVGQMQTYRR